jgi:HEAT repeat protein
MLVRPLMSTAGNKTVREPGDSAKRVAAASSVAGILCETGREARSRVLAQLKELYVSCDAGTCTTDPEVATAALPHARRALADLNPEIRITGARAIELFAIDAGDAVADLAQALVDPVAAVRLAALEALCEVGAGAAPVAAQIAERLTDAPTPEERAAAADALGNAGSQVEHLDTLLDALLHDVPAVQACAAHALGFALEHEREDRREPVSNALHRLSRAK